MRYILAANLMIPKKERYRITREIATSHHATPNGIRINITMGEVKGMYENTTEMVPWGSSITENIPT